MKIQNGLKVYDKGERISGYEDVEGDPTSANLGWGLKAVAIDGRRVWQALEQSEYMRLEAQRLGLSPEDVRQLIAEKNATCAASGPWSGCNGYCNGGLNCKMIDGSTSVYCACG